MEQYLQHILQYLHARPGLGELFAFLVAFAESLPVVGTIIPGTITMTVVGVLIGTGAVSGLLTLGLTSLAAFIGDCCGFILGRYCDGRIRTIWPFRKHPKWLAMGETFFEKHGGKSIVLGRFIGPARSTVPLVAGLLRLSWPRFIVAAIPSAVLWALMYTIPGIMLGVLSVEAPKGEGTKFFLYGLLFFAIIWFIFWVVQHFFLQLARLVNHTTDRLWHYLTKHHGGKFLIRLITNQQKPSDHHQLTLLLTAILSFILFLILLVNVMHHTILTAINFPVFHALQSIRTPEMDKIFVVLTIMGAPMVCIWISIIMSVGFLLRKQWRAGLHFLAGAGAAIVAARFFKHISHSLRPQGFVSISHTSSFPSGHTTASFAVYLLLSYFVSQLIDKKYRWIPWTLFGTLVFFVGFSRLYVGAHWVTDILGSSLIGTAVILCCIVSYRRMPNLRGQLRLPPVFTAILLFVSMAYPYSIYLYPAFSATLIQYQRVQPAQTIAMQAWWDHPLTYTPLYRNDRFGKPFQPLNVQWQGNLSQIKMILKQRGWVAPLKQTKLKSALQRFSSLNAEYHTPLLPWLYHNQPPVLFLIKHVPARKRIIELYLWDSHITLTPGNQTLWIGAVDVRLAPTELMSIRQRAKISLRNNIGLKNLIADTASLQQKLVTASRDQSSLRWNHRVLLMRTQPIM